MVIVELFIDFNILEENIGVDNWTLYQREQKVEFSHVNNVKDTKDNRI